MVHMHVCPCRLQADVASTARQVRWRAAQCMLQSTSAATAASRMTANLSSHMAAGGSMRNARSVGLAARHSVIGVAGARPRPPGCGIPLAAAQHSIRCACGYPAGTPAAWLLCQPVEHMPNRTRHGRHVAGSRQKLMITAAQQDGLSGHEAQLASVPQLITGRRRVWTRLCSRAQRTHSALQDVCTCTSR